MVDIGQLWPKTAPLKPNMTPTLNRSLGRLWWELGMSTAWEVFWRVFERCFARCKKIVFKVIRECFHMSSGRVFNAVQQLCLAFQYSMLESDGKPDLHTPSNFFRKVTRSVRNLLPPAGDPSRDESISKAIARKELSLSKASLKGHISQIIVSPKHL